MKIEYVNDVGSPMTIETAGTDQSYPWMRAGVVYNFHDSSDEYGPTEYSPTQARALAAALLQAADEADPEGTGHYVRTPPDNPSVRGSELRDTHLFVDARVCVGRELKGYKALISRTEWNAGDGEARQAAIRRVVENVVRVVGDVPEEGK